MTTEATVGSHLGLRRWPAAFLAGSARSQLWVPKTCATRADAPPNAMGAFPRPVPGEPVWPVRACDDPRFVGLKLIFLIVSRAMSLLVLSRRESWWKDAEILMLRHQLAVAQRERPQAQSRLTWPDRAWLAAARRDAAHRAPGGDAADRHSRHHLALAP